MKFKTKSKTLIRDMFTNDVYRADEKGIIEIIGNTKEKKDFIERCKRKLEIVEDKIKEDKKEIDNKKEDRLSYKEVKAKIKEYCEKNEIEKPKGYTRMSYNELEKEYKDLLNDK